MIHFLAVDARLSAAIQFRSDRLHHILLPALLIALGGWLGFSRFMRSEYLEQAKGKYREVRVIHGRGIGVQREIVRKLLSRRTDIAEYRDAPPEAGGWGATIVRFR